MKHRYSLIPLLAAAAFLGILADDASADSSTAVTPSERQAARTSQRARADIPTADVVDRKSFLEAKIGAVNEKQARQRRLRPAGQSFALDTQTENDRIGNDPIGATR